MSIIKSAIEDLKDFDVADIADFESMGDWPRAVKGALGVLVFGACIAAGYFLHIQKLQQDLQKAIAEESVLTVEFEQKAFFAANLEQYKVQMVEMDKSSAELLRQLPSKTEVPGLVDDITDAGLGSGLEFAIIELSDEVAQEIYIELPMEIDVEGSYHDFGTFVSGVASLPRIVTLHDFSIERKDDAFLTMSILAKTYRYKNEADEIIFTQ
ncbi:MAG: type 4a pilus biogenesis protein PilO [Gammaproteobacteria bacterium]|nr:type 4a pilus biogenesis protein PilO [Gammaproteobacteria bacterium]